MSLDYLFTEVYIEHTYFASRKGRMFAIWSMKKSRIAYFPGGILDLYIKGRSIGAISFKIGFSSYLIYTG